MCFLIFASTVYAVPACPEPGLFTQPEGTVIEVNMKGDEFLGWSEDSDGNLIVYDSSVRGFCYAVWTNDGSASIGELVGLSASEMMPASARVQGSDIPQSNRDQARQNREAEMMMLMNDHTLLDFNSLSNASSPSPQIADTADLKRTLLIIHVTWSDRTGIETDKLNGQQIYNLVFDSSRNSVNKYYMELFGVNTDVIIPARISSPLNGQQGVIEVQLEGKHTNPKDNSQARRKLLSDAIIKACSEGLVDLANFDLDHDNNLTTKELSIGFIVDGYNTASAGNKEPSIWAVATSFTPEAGDTNGIKIENYFAQGAFSGSQGVFTGNSDDDILAIGTVCHELGHCGYKFIDTYDYGTMQTPVSRGHGYWSLMGSGSWGRKSSSERSGQSPSYVDAYNMVRSKLIAPGTVSDGDAIKLNTHNDIYIVENNANNESQYFLLQQRKFGTVSNYDQGVFFRMDTASSKEHGGMLIYHADESVGNVNFNKASHYRAGIEEAHGGVQNLQQPLQTGGNYGDLNDLWGGEKDDFSLGSDPGSGLYSKFTNDLLPPDQNTPSGVKISEIAWSVVDQSTSLKLNPIYEVSLNPASDKNFVSVPEGSSTPVAHKVRIDNTGNQATDRLTIELSGQDPEAFVLSAVYIPNIEVGDSANFTVAPKDSLSEKKYSATVTVAGSNNIMASFNLSFEVQDASAPLSYSISLEPASDKIFASITEGDPTPTAHDVAINNTGNQETGGLTMELSGQDPEAFVISAASVSNIWVGDSTSFTVAPKDGLTKKSYSATVTVSGSNNIMASFNLSFEVNKVILGDVNGDDEVDIGDVNAVYLHVRGKRLLTGEELSNADVNKDGEVDIGDVNRIYLFVRGKITAL